MGERPKTRHELERELSDLRVIVAGLILRHAPDGRSAVLNESTMEDAQGRALTIRTDPLHGSVLLTLD